MTIIVTGGAGFIGSNFIFYMLKKHPGYRIICLDKLTYAGNLSTLQPVMDRENFRFVKMDICDRDGVYQLFEEEHPDMVVNFAAESHVDRSIENPEVFLQTNIIGTATLMDACRKYGMKDHYKGVPRYGLYEVAREKLKVPLGYNGDIFSVEAYQEIREKFPDADSVMYGRGLIARPYLLDAIMQKEDGEDHREEYRKKLRQFHDRLYRDYQEYLSGERNVLFRMKELWSYMAPGFTNYARYLKKIKKSQHFGDYEAAVMSLFGEQEILKV